MTALKEESVQKLGVIFVWNMMSDYSGGCDYEGDRMAIKTTAAVPIRTVARYLIFQCPLWKQVIEVLNHMISPHLRARTRSIHASSNSEAMYSLNCLGIPCNVIPVTYEGKISLDNQKRWIDKRKRLERSNDDSQAAETALPAKRRKLCV